VKKDLVETRRGEIMAKQITIVFFLNENSPLRILDALEKIECTIEGCGFEDNVLNRLRSKTKSLLCRWDAINIIFDEITAIEQQIRTDNSPFIETNRLRIFVSRIESFVFLSRALLDSYSYILSQVLFNEETQSINKLRKKQNLPDWLCELLKTAIDGEAPEENVNDGWLKFLVTENTGNQSLRDFIAHRGSIEIEMLSDNEGNIESIAFKPNKGAALSGTFNRSLLTSLF
jgi:hypothetical protein